MASMALLAVGAMGLVGMSMHSVQLNAEGRHLTRATAIAQDLLAQIQAWDFSDPRLAERLANDADLGDGSLSFQTGSPAIEYAEADLTLGGTEWHGLPTRALAGQYERYWNVARVDDDNHNGIADGVRIAVIVRWRQGLAWRRIVFFTAKPNPDPMERL
jgi:hypothetical protein